VVAMNNPDPLARFYIQKEEMKEGLIRGRFGNAERDFKDFFKASKLPV
jgi:hypothetical protein